MNAAVPVSTQAGSLPEAPAAHDAAEAVEPLESQVAATQALEVAVICRRVSGG